MERWQQKADGSFLLLKIQLMTIPLILSVLSLHLAYSPPHFSQPFYRWKASTFSVNGLQSSELNIDFIGSLVTAAVTTRCLLKKLHVRVSSRRNAEPRREGWRRWETEQRELEQRRWGREGGGFKRTTLKRKKGDRRGHKEPRRETRRTQGGWEERTRDSESSN